CPPQGHRSRYRPAAQSLRGPLAWPPRPRSQATAGHPGRGAAAAGTLSHDQAGQCPGRRRLRRHRPFLRPHWRWRKPWGAPPDPELWRRADQMPDVPGFAESWGTSIVPCPYCDGFEVADQHWGLVWSGPQSHQSVRLFHDWTDKLTVFADGHDIPPDIQADLARRNIPVVDGRIVEIAHNGSHS